MTENRFIFVGFYLDEDLRTNLENCKERNRVFLEDPIYLEKVRVGDDIYIGKRMKDSTALDRVEDTSKSVVSILSRLHSGWELKYSSATVLALEEKADVASGLPVIKNVDVD